MDDAGGRGWQIRPCAPRTQLTEIRTEDILLADANRESSFKVVDRRLFTEEGELRKDAIEQERRDAEAASKHPQPNAGKQPAGAAVAQGADASTTSAAAEGKEPSRSFQMLVDFLTRNAAAMLGGMADPRTGQAFLDLDGARDVIDMLDALREKTRGNLAKADEDLLIEVIGSLKLTFMEMSKAATEAMAKKAKVKG
jgi:Domain of unknown function (DUF1844)